MIMEGKEGKILQITHNGTDYYIPEESDVVIHLEEDEENQGFDVLQAIYECMLMDK